jgi:MoaA/NifB/PqqE/SkfB family radical SAM enzyme
MRFSPYFVKQAIKNLYRLPFFELARHRKYFVPLIPFRPLEAVIYLTENCNSRCITCNFWKQKSRGELTTAEIIEVLPQLKQLGVSYLCLTGGEPLLRRDLPQIVEAAHQQHFDKIQVITNALILRRAVAESLLNSGLNKITISLNGMKETHDMTRGVPGSYERCLEALRELTELRDSKYHHLDVNVNMTIMQQNLDEVMEVVKLCQQFDVGLRLTPVDDRSFFVPKDLSDLKTVERQKLNHVIGQLHGLVKKYPKLNETHTSLEYTKNYFTDPIRRDIPCYLGYLSIAIGAHGEVLSGCEVLPPVGNVREKPLAEIVGSQEYKQRLANMFAKKCPGCICGFDFNLYVHLPAILQEMLWMLHLKRINSTSYDNSHQEEGDYTILMGQITENHAAPNGQDQYKDNVSRQQVRGRDVW